MDNHSTILIALSYRLGSLGHAAHLRFFVRKLHQDFNEFLPNASVTSNASAQWSDLQFKRLSGIKRPTQIQTDDDSVRAHDGSAETTGTEAEMDRIGKRVMVLEGQQLSSMCTNDDGGHHERYTRTRS